MKPYEYQQKVIDGVIEKFDEGKSRVLMQAATGAGKTLMMSAIADYYVKHGEKAIITCHKEELIEQTAETLEAIGVYNYQKIYANTKRVDPNAFVYVCMVETLYNRLNKKRFKFYNIGLFIADECHVLVHNKNFDFFPKSKILGVTATPVHSLRIKFFRCKMCLSEYDNENKCCGEKPQEWSKPFKFADIYDDIVVGPPIKELIELGQLVTDVSYKKKYADFSKLKIDSFGDFSKKSLDDAFGSEDSVFNVFLHYKELCEGKRTIIYNSNTTQNLKVYEKFVEEGVDVRMYDSVNTEESGERDDVVEWFRNTPGAVLLNAFVFTTGLDVREIEAVIMNTATTSLSLFIQTAGRGGRSSNKIMKDHFIYIDGGGNIDRFGGEWSHDRDWEHIFFNGLGEERKKKEDIMDVQDCANCGMLFQKGEKSCPNCGFEAEPFVPKKEKKEVLSDEVYTPIRPIPPPNPEAIYRYTVLQGEGFAFALNLLYNRIVDMFKMYQVTKEKYEATKANGKLHESISKHVRPTYFYLIKSDLEGANRTLGFVIERSKKKVEEFYYKK